MKFNNRNVYISPKAKLGSRVRIGDNTSIYDNVEIGDDSIICNDSVVGEPLAAYYRDPGYKNPTTLIGAGSLVRSHTIIYAGCDIGPGFATGHRVTIRESTTIGEHCSIGTLSDIQGNVKMGKFCRLHSNVHLAQGSSLGDFVFMYPFSVMTNDPYPPSTDIRGGQVGDYTQIGVHAVVLPGIQVGQNCLIGANSVVNRKVPDFSLAMGDPIKVVMDIRKYVALGKGNPYPWMNRFDRGMPWQGMGYDAWMKQGAGK
ncbi:MAG TPA: DapH/DapD/GlmU-related protein [Candidatus Acidoferrum sp.]|nr:DapH/DapD/GlmU-related protein [Candidatus Acidoferrum sp.]